MSSTLLAWFGLPGHLELLIVAFVILLLFGHRLPGLMRSLGRGVVEFKSGLSGKDDDEEDLAAKELPAKEEKPSS